MNAEREEKVHRYLHQTSELFGDELYKSGVGEKMNPKEVEVNNDFGDIKSFEQEINTCEKCQLGSSRTKFVFGVGDPNANLLLVGEAPGKEEDIKGEPFVGRAGKLLDKILGAIDRKRDQDVYICNVLKCRPPDNRDPLPSEVELCEPYLVNQIRLIKPKIIVALGRVAGKTLLKVELPLKDMRGNMYDYFGTPLVVTYHPAALLRNPGFKRPTWEDFKWIRSYLEEN